MARVYPIIAPRDVREAPEAVRELLDLKVPFLQIRGEEPAEVLAAARRILEWRKGSGPRLVINDFLEVAQELGAGLHIGQEDGVDPKTARKHLGPEVPLGFSTHSVEEFRSALKEYGSVLTSLSLGPVFPTRSKPDARPPIGIAPVRETRRMLDRFSGPVPGFLVAIGGITSHNAADVFAAGADLVAVIGALRDHSGLLSRDVRKRIEEFEERVGGKLRSITIRSRTAS